MQPLYPLRFQPLLRRYLWGGTRLGAVLDKPVGDEPECAESWEVVDHDQDQSVVLAGPLAGQTLGQLVQQRGPDIFGRHFELRQRAAAERPELATLTRFPLLFKFLDAAKPLSVQVHPNDAQAAELDPPDLGKTEAWVILEAEPGSKIYAGLKRGFDRPAFERELHRGTCELCLHSFEPKPGDCVFIPAGTVHAIGAGILLGEIQQASDVTYRVFDWNRVGADGKPRPLHIEQALASIDFAAGPVSPQVPQPTDRAAAERLVDCDKFVLDRVKLDAPLKVGGDQRFHLLAVLEGSVQLAGDPLAAPLSRGQTAVLPASLEEVRLTPEGTAVLLDICLP